MLDKDRLYEFKDLVDKSQRVLVLQPDVEQVDPDSIRSALAIGGLLEGQGKDVTYYLSGEMPTVFQIIPGAEKFTQEFPEQYDMSILVDCGGPVGQMPETIARFSRAFEENPFVIIDHHANRKPAPFSTLDLVDEQAIATAEPIWEMAQEFGWPVTAKVAEDMIWSILSDSAMLALCETWETVVLVGELARISQISVREFYARDQEIRRLPFEIFQKKVELLDKIEFYLDGRMAIIFISKEVDNAFKKEELDGPGHLLRPEMREIRGVELQVTLTENKDGSYRASARSSDETGLAAKLAGHFGGGGHAGAAGFMVKGKSQGELRSEIIQMAEEILGK